ncbi:cellulosome protein [Sphingomonas sp. 22176]|uniref:cellulosome protein n=1 Tax=Sphingomonas sp. 22176 TaxID=3453884 RepID=UPI003F833A26
MTLSLRRSTPLAVSALLGSVSLPALAQERITVDLASDTGAFHGGAAGTLYGLYDARLPHPNLVEGMGLRTVSTKAQDGPQHPGADALEVSKLLTDASGGDTYIYMTDINREFPYDWKTGDCAQSITNYIEKLRAQVRQAWAMAPRYRNRIVFIPYNEPDGNMFAEGPKSCNGVSWRKDPTAFNDAWDRAVRMIRQEAPGARIAGPNTSVLFPEVEGFLRHTIAADTVPDVITWHELSNPATVSTSVRTFRAWEDRLFAGTKWESRHLPININEYAHNYHTSVPGQMVQWVAAIEQSKIDADIAYWNIDGNLSDSAVQANRGNGQWWMFNAYATMGGHTLAVTPPHPDESYTLQGVATLDPARAQMRMLFGGTSGAATVALTHVSDRFGDTVRVRVREIGWTGQLGDSAPPVVVGDRVVPVREGQVAVAFGQDGWPNLREEAAYELLLTPGKGVHSAAAASRWRQDYEAELAARRGTGLRVRGPEGSPEHVDRFHVSGGYAVEGFKTDADAALDFTVDVPHDGRYDLSVLASTFNKDPLAATQGPTNVFLQIDGRETIELFLPLGYKPAVLDHSDTVVSLTRGRHTLTLSTRSLDGAGRTQGNALIDRITLAAIDPAGDCTTYDVQDAVLKGTSTPAGSAVVLAQGSSATFWVYAAQDGLAQLAPEVRSGSVRIAANGRDTMGTAFLLGGINKVVLTATTGASQLRGLSVVPEAGHAGTVYEAEDAQLAGTARIGAASLASKGAAVFDIGGAPGNGNTLTFPEVTVARAGTYALTIRYSNEEQAKATHYNPDPLARIAWISINDGKPVLASFPHSFNANNWWEMTVPVTLKAGGNSIRFSGEAQPDWDGRTFASQRWPGIQLRSRFAPNIDRITVTAMP